MRQVTVNVPDMLVANVRGTELPFNLASQDDDVLVGRIIMKLAEYGMRKFNDASPMGAVAPKDEADKEAFRQDCAKNARVMMDDWLAGDFATERGGRVADPLSQKAREIARALVVRKYGKLGKDATDGEKAEFADRVRKAAALDKVIDLARAELKKAESLADLI